MEYTVLRSKMLKQGQFEFAVRECKEDAEHLMAVLEGVSGKRNPLQSVRNVEMKIETGKIVAVNLEGDCVIKK